MPADSDRYGYETDDGRYSQLRVAVEVVHRAMHNLNGVENPLFWARTFGPCRVVYSAFGHNLRDHELPQVRDLLAPRRPLADELSESLS